MSADTDTRDLMGATAVGVSAILRPLFILGVGYIAKQFM